MRVSKSLSAGQLNEARRLLANSRLKTAAQSAPPAVVPVVAATTAAPAKGNAVPERAAKSKKAAIPWRATEWSETTFEPRG